MAETQTNLPGQAEAAAENCRHRLANQIKGQKPRRVTACLSVSHDPGTNGKDIEEAMQLVIWEERGLQWHDAKVSHVHGGGFSSSAMGVQFSDTSQEDLPPRQKFLGDVCSGLPLVTEAFLEICCSLESPIEEARSVVAELLLGLLEQFCRFNSNLPLKSAQVLLLSTATRLPLMSLPNGIASLDVPFESWGTGCGLERATTLFEHAGMYCISDAISSQDVRTLRSLVVDRIRDAEQSLRNEGTDIGCGDIHYAEICSRGKLRWDLLLHAAGERQGVGDVNGDERFAVLEHIARYGVWVPAVEQALGKVKWQASVVCSRPGAPAGRWHTDGPHSRFTFEEGESGPVYAVCVFIPLVQLEAPIVADNGLVKHGLGCTAFWPGSHRHPECKELGAVMAEHTGAIVPGAPLQAGAAVVYDYRVVHCGTPNDAFEFQEGDRPILQLLYCLPQYDDIDKNYGYYQLFYD